MSKIHHRVTVTQTLPNHARPDNVLQVELEVLAIDEDHALCRVLEWYDYDTWRAGQRAWHITKEDI